MAIELNKLAINCRKLINELPFIIENLLTSDEALKLINANIDSWNKGLKPNQEPIENKFTQSTWYSQTWERERKRKGLKTDHFYLQYTGDFAKSLVFDIVIIDNIVHMYIVSNDDEDKKRELFKMFGEDIIGVPKDALDNFISWFKNQLLIKIKQTIFAV